MTHRFQYTISKEQEGRRIWEYLRSGGYSHRLVSQIKRAPDGILLNEVRVPSTAVLHAGDVLTVTLQESPPDASLSPWNIPLSICYEDADLLAVDKPAGMPVYATKQDSAHTLANAVMSCSSEPFSYHCINRLDRDTSGLILIAKHALSASILSTDLAGRNIQRTYLGLVEGQLTQSGCIDAPIARIDGPTLRRRVDFEHGQPAVTWYEPLRYLADTDLTLVSFRLGTGRTHQIRVHMQYLGHPITGDFLYPSRRDLLTRQALHAWKLDFIHPITKEAMHLCAPLPADFKTFVNLNLF